ncbi:hypothetical protein BDQ17DRAFT_1340036 [Cyathus striatus]|nr:hypothetical protein BDQ17DRAFT_1340036 [Cyathus striatus]
MSNYRPSTSHFVTSTTFITTSQLLADAYHEILLMSYEQQTMGDRAQIKIERAYHPVDTFKHVLATALWHSTARLLPLIVVHTIAISRSSLSPNNSSYHTTFTASINILLMSYEKQSFSQIIGNDGLDGEREGDDKHFWSMGSLILSSATHFRLHDPTFCVSPLEAVSPLAPEPDIAIVLLRIPMGIGDGEEATSIETGAGGVGVGKLKSYPSQDPSADALSPVLPPSYSLSAGALSAVTKLLEDIIRPSADFHVIWWGMGGVVIDEGNLGDEGLSRIFVQRLQNVRVKRMWGVRTITTPLDDVSWTTVWSYHQVGMLRYSKTSITRISKWIPGKVGDKEDVRSAESMPRKGSLDGSSMMGMFGVLKINAYWRVLCLRASLCRKILPIPCTKLDELK